MTIKTKYDIGQSLFIARKCPYIVACEECSGTGKINIIDGNMNEVSFTCGKCNGSKNVTKHVLVPIKTTVKEIKISDTFKEENHICYIGEHDFCYNCHFTFLDNIYYHRENYVVTDEAEIIKICDCNNGFNTLDFISKIQPKY